MYCLASSATHHLTVQHEGTGPLLLTRGGAYAEYPEGGDEAPIWRPRLGSQGQVIHA